MGLGLIVHLPCSTFRWMQSLRIVVIVVLLCRAAIQIPLHARSPIHCHRPQKCSGRWIEGTTSQHPARSSLAHPRHVCKTAQWFFPTVITQVRYEALRFIPSRRFAAIRYLHWLFPPLSIQNIHPTRQRQKRTCQCHQRRDLLPKDKAPHHTNWQRYIFKRGSDRGLSQTIGSSYEVHPTGPNQPEPRHDDPIQ